MTERERREAQAVTAVWVVTGGLLLASGALVIAVDSLRVAEAPPISAPAAPAAPVERPALVSALPPLPGLVPAPRPRRVVVIRRSRAS